MSTMVQDVNGVHEVSMFIRRGRRRHRSYNKVIVPHGDMKQLKEVATALAREARVELGVAASPPEPVV